MVGNLKKSLARLAAGACALLVSGCSTIPPRSQLSEASADEFSVIAAAMAGLNESAHPLPWATTMPLADLAVTTSPWSGEWTDAKEKDPPLPPSEGPPVRLDSCKSALANGPADLKRVSRYAFTGRRLAFNYLWVTRPGFSADGAKAAVLVTDGADAMGGWLVRLERSQGGSWKVSSVKELWRLIVVG